MSGDNVVMPVDSLTSVFITNQTPLDYAFQIQYIQQQLKKLQDIMILIQENLAQQDENIQNMQSEEWTKTPRPTGRWIKILESRGDLFFVNMK